MTSPWTSAQLIRQRPIDLAECQTALERQLCAALADREIAEALAREAAPSGDPAGDATGMIVLINSTDYEFFQSDTGNGWYAVREDGAVTAGYYPDQHDLADAICQDAIEYE